LDISFTKRRGEAGSGIGLSIVKDIIEDHPESSINVKSRSKKESGPGKKSGTAFTIAFPLFTDEDGIALETMLNDRHRILRGLWHDMNNMMLPIMNYATLIKRRLPAYTPEYIFQQLSLIESSGNRLVKLIVEAQKVEASIALATVHRAIEESGYEMSLNVKRILSELTQEEYDAVVAAIRAQSARERAKGLMISFLLGVATNILTFFLLESRW